MTDELKIDRPIDGKITRRNRNRVPQQGSTDFLAALDKLFAYDFVEKVGWQQYTPYFMDGDPCEFGIHEIAVKIGEVEDADDEAYGFDGGGWYTRYGLSNRDWSTAERKESWEIEGHNTRDLHATLTSINWGAFENVMEDNFGDHANVEATRDGFSVEYYEHD